MLNETCSFEQPIGFSILHIISSSVSIPIYGIAFWILIFKSPSHFNKYRNYLVAHIMSGLLLEIHMGTIWKVTVVLPIPIMCSNGPLAEYSPIIFQVLPALLIYTGVSALSLFIYRMEAVIVYRYEPSKLRKWIYYTKYGFYFSIIFVLLFSFLIYPDLKYQMEYKSKMEKRFGTFSEYMWCDNCFFMNFDSKVFMLFYVFCGLSTALCFTSTISALIMTIKVLNSINTQLSERTAGIHKNFLQSLVLTAWIHIICILLPLLGFLLTISVLIRLSQFPYVPYILVMIIQEHGAASTVTMFLTNNLLRRTMKKMLPIQFENSTHSLTRTTSMIT